MLFLLLMRNQAFVLCLSAKDGVVSIGYLLLPFKLSYKATNERKLGLCYQILVYSACPRYSTVAFTLIFAYIFTLYTVSFCSASSAFAPLFFETWNGRWDGLFGSHGLCKYVVQWLTELGKTYSE